MGYTTKFTGHFDLDRQLTMDQYVELNAFNELDHRDVEGGTYKPEDGNYCQWVPTKDGRGIEWDGNEKFYAYVEWLEVLIERFFKPWGLVLSGRVAWQGEDRNDRGVIHAKDNRVQAIKDVIHNPTPTIEHPEPRWGDE